MDTSPDKGNSIGGITLFAGGTSVSEATGQLPAAGWDSGNHSHNGQPVEQREGTAIRPDRTAPAEGGANQEGDANMVTSGAGGNQDTNGQILATGAPIQSIKLADGKEWKLKPLNLNMLMEIEEKCGKFTGEMVAAPSMKMLRYILYARLKPYDSTLTEDRVGELVDTSVLAGLKSVLEF